MNQVSEKNLRLEIFMVMKTVLVLWVTPCHDVVGYS